MSALPVVAVLVVTFLNHCYYDTPIARVASGMVDVANDLADTFHPRGDFRHEHAESQKAWRLATLGCDYNRVVCARLVCYIRSFTSRVRIDFITKISIISWRCNTSCAW